MLPGRRKAITLHLVLQGKYCVWRIAVLVMGMNLRVRPACDHSLGEGRGGEISGQGRKTRGVQGRGPLWRVFSSFSLWTLGIVISDIQVNSHFSEFWYTHHVVSLVSRGKLGA